MSHSPRDLHQHTIHQLYLEHHSWLIQWLKKRVHHPHSATDIVQDTFVRLIQGQDRLNTIREPRAWLVNMAKNIFIDQHRRYLLEKTYLEQLAQQFEIEETEIDRQTLEESIILLDMLTLALKDSDEDTRNAFLLYYLEGYTQSEIAAQLGKSLRTVQNYLAQGLAQCFAVRQQLLTDDEHDCT